MIARDGGSKKTCGPEKQMTCAPFLVRGLCEKERQKARDLGFLLSPVSVYGRGRYSNLGKASMARCFCSTI
jgi:hypothetical protein